MFKRTVRFFSWMHPKDLDCINHFKKHGSKIGASSAQNYHEMAEYFTKFQVPKLGKDGRLYYYCEVKDLFAVKDLNGPFRTFFKPDPFEHGFNTNMEYYKSKLL